MRESSTVPVAGKTAVTVNFLPSSSSEAFGRSFRHLGVLRPEAATSAPTRTSFSSSVEMIFLRLRVFLSSDSIIPTELPQPTGRERMPAPPQAFFA